MKIRTIDMNDMGFADVILGIKIMRKDNKIINLTTLKRIEKV